MNGRIDEHRSSQAHSHSRSCVRNSGRVVRVLLLPEGASVASCVSIDPRVSTAETGRVCLLDAFKLIYISRSVRLWGGEALCADQPPFSVNRFWLRIPNSWTHRLLGAVPSCRSTWALRVPRFRYLLTFAPVLGHVRCTHKMNMHATLPAVKKTYNTTSAVARAHTHACTRLLVHDHPL